MKALLEVQQIILQVSGREMTFSEEELVAILGKHFDTEVTQQKEKNVQKQAETEVAQTPTEGKWFNVNPTEIDQRLFSEKKSDQRQEKTRQRILEAFSEMKNNPKYARPFKTLMPKKTWNEKYVSELIEIACNLGDHMADRVEQALEWAQRIANGETWKEVCNNPDTANWYRLIEWKNGCTRLVGGSRESSINYPASYVYHDYYYPNLRLSSTVPLVVLYK